MTPEEKLKIYRRFILMTDEFLREHYVEISSCRVLFGIQLGRLIKDAEAAEKGIELPELGTGIRMTEAEKIENQDRLNKLENTIDKKPPV